MSVERPTVGATIRPHRPSALGRDAVLLAVLVLFLWATLSLNLRLDRLVALPGSILGLLEQMFLPPDWSYVSEAFPAMVVSVQMAWIGTLIGAVLSLPLGFLAANNVSPRPVSAAVRVVLDAIRAFPELVLAVVIFVPITGLGPYAGALAIGIHSVGTLGKLTAEAIESIDRGPVEAARAAGASGLQIQRWGVVPQVLPEIIAFWLYRFEVNVRAATVLGVVGAGGIGSLLQETLRYGRYSKSGMVVLVIIVVTLCIDAISGRLRRRVIEGPGTARPTATQELVDPALLLAEPSAG